MTNLPAAKKIPQRFEKHGDIRVDDYFWMREKENPEVIAHLNAENAYTATVLAPDSGLKDTLFAEIKARVKQDDSEVPYKDGPYVYYSRMEADLQYAILCRKKIEPDLQEAQPQETQAEEIVLDCNALAQGQKYFKLGDYEMSPDHRWIAYAVDFDGSEKHTIFFKDTLTGQLSPESIPGAAASLEWANDNCTLFYTMLDEQERPDRLLRHTLGDDPTHDQLIYKELDSQLFVYCSKSRSERFVFIELQGKVTSEVHYLDANNPLGSFRVIEPRRRGVLYSVTHHADRKRDRFFIVTNDNAQNFRLAEAPIDEPSASNWKTIRAGSKEVFIESAEAFAGHLVLHERENGLQQLRVIDLKDFSDHLIALPEPTYALGGQANAEFDSTVYRFGYNSMVTPSTVYDYDIPSRQLTTKKIQEILSGYDRSQYRSERTFATAPDGTMIPVSVVYRLDSSGEFERRAEGPLYLYAYGSYGISSQAAFSLARLSLLDRGFVCAIAHVRGGSELGRQWYEDGKFLKKKNTFTDFIACAEHLVSEGFCKKGQIAIMGGSAGGMLVGAVINERPDLFHAAVAHVPFVDVVNTMLDNTLPLTTIEYEEWGNPIDPEYYHYMKSYSPYDNIRAQAYPHLLVTSGLHDPRVTYWEPAKWVAKLRELKTDQNLLLQKINMEAGHGGPSGRYESLKQTALEYAFLLRVFGKTK